MTGYIAAIDQGTTSSRTIIFDEHVRPVATAQLEFEQIYPRSGWVEHRAGDIWQSSLTTLRQAIKRAGITADQLAGIGITNQRETVMVWDRETGEPVCNAIVWQDRRTSAVCSQLKQAGEEPLVQGKTGLLLDPYFSGSKIGWILDNIEGVRERAEKGELACGTVDTWLIWQLTGGRSHLTDATNASRTMLFNIHENDWDAELLSLFDIPSGLLPEVRDCADSFGHTDEALLGASVPILGVAGDQHAALIGQACFEPGLIKSTYGTGCFVMMNTGAQAVPSNHRLLTTVGYRLDGQTTYALEGSIFIAGAAVQWLRDGLGIIGSAAETGELAASADDGHHVYLVPAFVGLGAPHWDAEARGTMFGLTRNSGPKEFARAALESVGYQTRELLEAFAQDWTGMGEARLRVDGGMTASDWTMQFLADILDCEVDRPVNLETTALGAAYLAGLQAGLYPPPSDFSEQWQLERTFGPQMPSERRDTLLSGWREAVSRTLS